MPESPLVIYSPKATPVLRCAVDRVSLNGPEVARLSNFRTDSLALIVRLPDAIINASPPSGALGPPYNPLGSTQGFANGTAYFLSAWATTDGKVGIFSQDLTTGAYTEITDPGASPASTWGGDATGCSRFPTVAPVVFSQQTKPTRVAFGSVIPRVDVIVIQNGSDQAIVYNPASGLASAAALMWNPGAITVPAQANAFNVFATFSAFWQVRGNTKTYFSSGAVNEANHFKMSDSALVYGVSDATLKVVQLVLGTAATTNDIATVEFPASGTTNRETFQGQWLTLWWDSTQSNLTYILKDSKLEIGKQNVGYSSVTTWTTLYDPTSSDPQLSQLPAFIILNGGSNYIGIPFSLQNISTQANRQAYHIRLTRMNATAPSAAITAYLIAATSTGAGGGFPYATEWSIVYKDIYSEAESPPYVQQASSTDTLYNCGGPRGPDASSTTPIVFPPNTLVWYDYRLKVKMPTSNSNISGGLQGQPSNVDIYFRNPATESTALYWSTWQIWNPVISSGHIWQSNAQSGAGGTETLNTEQLQNSGGGTPDGCGYNIFGQVDYAQRDPGVPVPDDWNASIPTASVIQSALGRLFVGNTKYTGGSSPQEVRFSDYGFYARFRKEPDITNPNSGGFLTYSGETVKAFKTSAAAALGAVTFYVWTDQSFNALGTAGGTSFAGSGFNGYTLGINNRISGDGTKEPGSIIERNGQISWVNKEGHVVFSTGGIPQNISIGYVTNSQGISNASVLDIIADIPSSRRGHIRGVHAKHRFYWFMTPAGATVNSRCAIFNLDSGTWETLDTLTNGEQATRVFDSSQPGAGVRILLQGTDGKTYGYEEGSGQVSAELVTRGFIAGVDVAQAAPGNGFTVKEAEIICELDAAATATMAVHRNMGSTAYTFDFALDSETTDEWLVVYSTADDVLTGWGAYFDCTFTMDGGKKITSVLGYYEPTEADERVTAG